MKDTAWFFTPSVESVLLSVSLRVISSVTFTASG